MKRNGSQATALNKVNDGAESLEPFQIFLAESSTFKIVVSSFKMLQATFKARCPATQVEKMTR